MMGLLHIIKVEVIILNVKNLIVNQLIKGDVMIISLAESQIFNNVSFYRYGM